LQYVTQPPVRAIQRVAQDEGTWHASIERGDDQINRDLRFGFEGDILSSTLAV
jgi:hypothetical protein